MVWNPLDVSRVRLRLFRISPEEATFAHRGFYAGSTVARQRLEAAGRTFVEGYTRALECDSFDDLPARVAAIPAPLRGFAFEGAGMAAAVLDLVTPWRRPARFPALLAAASQHVYMIHVGAG